MTLDEILEKNIKNGRFFAIEAETEKKRGGIAYRKHTTLTAQFGCNYENLTAVKAMGERKSTGSTWFTHTKHDGIVRNKKDESKLYLQIMNPMNVRVTYTLADGTPTTREELVKLGAMREEAENKPLTLVFALESIVSINYKGNHKNGVMAA